ncbi:MAG: hypothetical protein K2L12_07910 [Clostridia bacterium]|nr:hypothetical protein [Clostridia bacterium]
MLITFIVTVAILAVLYLLINICNKKIDKPNYDFSTGAPKSLLIFAHTVFGAAIFVVALEIVIYFLWKDKTALWAIFGIFLTFAILALIILYGLYFTYEAISGDEVYIHKFFTIKKVKVSDIRSVNNIGTSGFGFYDKNNKCLFRADSFTLGINELIRLINERKSAGSNEDFQEDAFAEEKVILTKLGREYRESYNKRKKKFIINFSAVSTVILLAVVLLLFFIGTDTATIVGIGLLGAFALAFNLFVFLSNMKKELNTDDESLGNKYKFTNKRVKGASRNKFKQICILCVCYMILGVALTLPMLGIIGEHPNYDEFTPITGKIEYYREHTGRNSYIAIGFYDIPTEYRLSSIFLDELDYSFFDEVKVDDTVTILTGNDKNHEFSLRGVSKKQWNDFYYLATDGKEYFTYEDYVKSHEHNDKVGFILVGIGIAAFVASAVTLTSAYFVCKKREKEEDIVIYK